MKKILLIISLMSLTAFSSSNVDFLNARITHGSLGIGAGSAKVYFVLNDSGDIDSLNVSAEVGFLFFKEHISRVVDINDLVRGEALEFRMLDGGQSILKVKPGRNFTLRGGDASLLIWNGEKYMSEKIRITKPDFGKPVAYKVTKNGSLKKIKKLKINMRGTKISEMYVGKFSLETY